MDSVWDLGHHREGYHATWRIDLNGHRPPAAGNADERERSDPGGRGERGRRLRTRTRGRKLIFINLPLSEERSGKGRRREGGEWAAQPKFDCFSDEGTDERANERTTENWIWPMANASNMSKKCPSHTQTHFAQDGSPVHPSILPSGLLKPLSPFLTPSQSPLPSFLP